MNQPDLKAQYALTVLRITCEESDEGRDVLLSFNTPVKGVREDVALLHAPIEFFGLPKHDVCEADEMPAGPFQIPEFLVPSIQTVIESHVPAGTPLWLEFGEPCGALPVVPWEQLLSISGHPVLRIPSQPIMPETPADSFDAVVCFSSPMSKELLPDQLVQRFIAQIPPDLAREVTFHLFADAAVQELLRSVQERFGREFRIQIYDPAEAPEYRRADPGRAYDVIENPWLIWMRESLRGQSADVLHFLCHGYVRRGRGALALAESPVRNVNRDWAAFISAGELAAFLNDVGAWSVAFTSPPGNHSPAGLRLLQHELAQMRPGPVLLHDMLTAAESDLGNTYRFLYTREPAPPVLSPGIALYCHPHRVLSGRVEPDDASRETLRSYTLSGKVSGVKQSRWVASSQRILEQAAVRVNAAADTSTKEARQGAENALRWVSDLIAKHAAAEKSAGEKGDK